MTTTVRNLILPSARTINILAQHLSQPGSVAVIDLGPVRAFVANGRNTHSEAKLWNLKQRQQGKVWGTWGDEQQILDLVDLSRVPENLRFLFDLNKLSIFRGSFLRFPCVPSLVPDALRAPNDTHQVYIPNDSLNRELQYKIRQRFPEKGVPLLIATSFNISGLTPGKSDFIGATRLAQSLGVPYVAHRILKSPLAGKGSNVIFAVTPRGIELKRYGQGQDAVIRALSKEGLKVLFPPR